MNQAGQEITAEVQAKDSREALSKVLEQGLFPLSLKEKTGKKPLPPLPKLPPRKSSEGGIWFGASLKQIIQFTRQFATMQEAGLPISKSLEILLRQQRPGSLRTAISKMLLDVEGGMTLTEAMAKHPAVFDGVYVKMVEAGETGGFLEQILVRIADAKERTLGLRRRVIRAMIYPAIVMSIAILILVFVLVVIIPMIADAMGGRQIGGPLQSLMHISDWFIRGQPPGWMVAGGIPVVAWLLKMYISRSKTGKYIIDQFKMSLPVWGRIIYKSAVVRFSRVLGSLLGAGVPIIDAIQASRDTAGNEVFARSADRILEIIREGSSFSSAAKRTHLFDPVAINMMEVGDETGDLDKMLLKLADNYEADVDTHVSYMLSMLEVALIIFMCAGVVGIIFAILISLGPLITGAAAE